MKITEDSKYSMWILLHCRYSANVNFWLYKHRNVQRLTEFTTYKVAPVENFITSYLRVDMNNFFCMEDPAMHGVWILYTECPNFQSH